MKQNVRLLSRIFFIITVFWKSRYQTCRIIFSNLRCVVTHISAHRHVIYIQFRQKETRKYLHLHKLSGKINSFSEPRFKESTKFDKLSPSFHLQSSRTLPKPLIESSIRRNYQTFTHLVTIVITRVFTDRSIDRSRRIRSTRVLSKRKREKRERVPRPILDRNEANGRRIVGPGFRAGNFSYARFRGKNKTGCRKRNERRSSPPGGHLPVYRRHALSARYGQGRKRF